MRPVIAAALRDFRRSWKQLFAADLIYKAIAFALLTPLVAFLFHLLLWFSGDSVLADQDILFFLLTPIGWICMISVGGLSIGIAAVELAALMVIVASDRQPVRTLGAIRFATANIWPVTQVTARMVAVTLLVAAPFLAVAGAVYATLLTQYDINFYLKEKPPVFLVAIGIAVVIVISLTAILIRLYAGWFYALPLVLFEGVRPADALKKSHERALGHRRTLFLAILGWLVVTFALSAMTTSAVVWLGSLVVPRATGSLTLLALVVGLSLLASSIVALAVNLLSMTSFAAIQYRFYRQRGGGGEIDPAQLNLATADPDRPGYQLTLGRLVSLTIVGILLALSAGLFAMRDVRLDDDVDIIAHRGASAAAPENTMAAIKQAIADEADWVEIDVQETADGEVVVFHDSDFMKLSGVDLKIWDATASDLQQLDIGSWFDPSFGDQRVPTLAEVLRHCKGKIDVNIELKYYGHDEQLEKRVVEIIEAEEMTDHIVTMSLKLDAVKKMKQLRPDWSSGLLMSVAAGDLGGVDVDFLAVNAGFVSRGFVQRAHRRGQLVYVWTVNDAASMSSMISRGVDGLITDKPALARSVLAQRAQMSAPERLLIELADSFGVVPRIAEQ